jgi:hypothetical protein
MSVVQGHEKLVLAAKQLLADWQVLKETWRDENCRQFEDKYIALLESEIRAAALAMDRAQAAIHGARQDCGDNEGADV